MSETVIMETTQTISDSRTEETIKVPEGKGFHSEQNILACEENAYDSCDEWDQDGDECPICYSCNCESQECKLEMERQEFYAEYWAYL